MTTKTGILLINLGTPDNCDVPSVRRYLNEFLNDPYVIDLPYLVRQILLKLVILPTRPKQSAHAYQKIWTKEGSPLLIHSQALENQLRTQLDCSFKIALGMRYGSPTIKGAMEQLKDVEQLIVLPLYPQYSTAATESSLQAVRKVHQSWQPSERPELKMIDYFYDAEEFITAQAKLIDNHLDKNSDFLLFSYHGLPERQLIKQGCQPICRDTCPPSNPNNPRCYRMQSFHTTSLISQKLGLKPEQYTTSFQSRLGKTPWIVPYTDHTLTDLRKKGVENLAVVCPSFVADCLETLEEIGIQAKEQWIEAGGKQFKLIPCLNAEQFWVDGLSKFILNQL